MAQCSSQVLGVQLLTKTSVAPFSLWTPELTEELSIQFLVFEQAHIWIQIGIQKNTNVQVSHVPPYSFRDFIIIQATVKRANLTVTFRKVSIY